MFSGCGTIWANAVRHVGVTFTLCPALVGVSHSISADIVEFLGATFVRVCAGGVEAFVVDTGRLKTLPGLWPTQATSRANGPVLDTLTLAGTRGHDGEGRRRKSQRSESASGCARVWEVCVVHADWVHIISSTVVKITFFIDVAVSWTHPKCNVA